MFNLPIPNSKYCNLSLDQFEIIGELRKPKRKIDTQVKFLHVRHTHTDE
jgi:hypothetical protein